MSDKRPKGSQHEPHRKPIGARVPLEMAVGAPSVSDAILIDRGPACSNCERLEREIAYLKGELAKRRL